MKNTSNLNAAIEPKIENPKTIILEAHKEGVNALRNGDLITAEKALIKVIKPVLSKPYMRNPNIKLEEVKKPVLNALHNLGRLYALDENYSEHHAKAAAIYQYCAQFSEKYETKIETNTSIVKDRDYFVEEALLMEIEFLKSIGSSQGFASEENKLILLKNIRKDVNKYKLILDNVRQITKEALLDIADIKIENIELRSDAVQEIYRISTEFFVNNNQGEEPGLIQMLLNDCSKQLGNAPEGCEYAVFGLGSLAIGTMTPWSDLEFGILINEDKEEYKEYLRNLVKLLKIKVINLGETILPSLGIESLNNYKTAKAEDEWFWDDVVKRGFSFDGSNWEACKFPLGRQGYKYLKKINTNYGVDTIIDSKPDYELILTPKQLACFQEETNDNCWFKSDKHLVQSLRSLCFIHGTSKGQELVDEYRSLERQAANDNIFESRALEILKEDLAKFSLKLGNEEEGKLLNVKKDIYRLTDRIIVALSNYYNISAEIGQKCLNVWDILDKIKEYGMFNSIGKQHLKEALGIAAELRLSTYHNNFGQKEMMSSYVPVAEHLNEKARVKLVNELFHIKDTSMLHHFYLVMLKVQSEVESESRLHIFGKINLKDNNLIHDSSYFKGMVCARFLEYDRALEYLERSKILENNKTLELFQNLYFLYDRTAKLNEAQSITQETLDLIREREYIPDRKVYLEVSYNNLGNTCVNKANYDEAEKYFLKALELCLERLNNNLFHPDLSDTYANLAKTYKYQCRYDKALIYFNKVLEIEKVIYQDKPHPHIADNYRELGIIYCRKDDYKEAISHFEKTLEIELKFYELQPNHPSIAITYNNLGSAYLRIENYEGAEKCFHNALKIRCVVYRNVGDHHEIAGTYLNLGNLYKTQGNNESAIEYYDMALNMQLRVYGNSNHPDIAATYNCLGGAYLAIEKYDMAEQYYEKSLEILINLAGDYPNNSFISDIYNNMRILNKNKGLPTKVAEYYEKALMSKLKTVDKEYKDEIANSYSYLGDLYSDSVNYIKASFYYQKALEIRSYLHKGSNPNLASNYNLIGNNHFSSGNYKEAIVYYQKALNMKLEVFKDNPNNQNVAMAYNNLAVALESIGHYEESLLNHKQALLIREKIYSDNPDNTEIADSYNNIAICLKMLSRIDEAIEYINKSIEIRIKICDNQGLALAYDNLGTAYGDKGEYKKAIENCENSLSLRLDIYKNTPNHPKLNDSYNNLGALHMQMGNLEKAEEFLSKALESKLVTYNGDQTNTNLVSTYTNLGTVHFLRKNYSESKTLLTKAKKILTIIPNPKALGHINTLLEKIENINLYDKYEPNKISNDNQAYIDSINKIGKQYFLEGNYQKAVEQFNQALSLSGAPNHSLFYNLARSYHLRGDYAKAFDFYSKVLELAPGHEKVLNHIETLENQILGETLEFSLSEY